MPAPPIVCGLGFTTVVVPVVAANIKPDVADWVIVPLLITLPAITAPVEDDAIVKNELAFTVKVPLTNVLHAPKEACLFVITPPSITKFPIANLPADVYCSKIKPLVLAEEFELVGSPMISV